MVNLSARPNVKVRDLTGLVVAGHAETLLRMAD
jgi:hypothetical protein